MWSAHRLYSKETVVTVTNSDGVTRRISPARGGRNRVASSLRSAMQQLQQDLLRAVDLKQDS